MLSRSFGPRPVLMPLQEPGREVFDVTPEHPVRLFLERDGIGEGCAFALIPFDGRRIAAIDWQATVSVWDSGGAALAEIFYSDQTHEFTFTQFSPEPIPLSILQRFIEEAQLDLPAAEGA